MQEPDPPIPQPTHDNPLKITLRCGERRTDYSFDPQSRLWLPFEAPDDFPVAMHCTGTQRWEPVWNWPGGDLEASSLTFSVS